MNGNYSTYGKEDAYRKRNIYATYKKFSLSAAAVPSFASYPGYPSYLGVSIFPADEKYMGRNLLGFTNGNFIVVKRGVPKSLRLFVQFHEEEHVKDMWASEKIVDQRALKRLMKINTNKKELKEVRALLRKRWMSLTDFPECGFHNFSLPEKKGENPARNAYYTGWSFDTRF